MRFAKGANKRRNIFFPLHGIAFHFRTPQLQLRVPLRFMSKKEAAKSS
jgi:hypothetical protein